MTSFAHSRICEHNLKNRIEMISTRGYKVPFKFIRSTPQYTFMNYGTCDEGFRGLQQSRRIFFAIFCRYRQGRLPYSLNGQDFH